MPNAHDIATKTTDAILALLEQGVAPWRKPWTSTGASTPFPVNLSTKKPYRGVNVLTLWAVGLQRGYTGNAWLTYKQAQALGGNVRKGEHGAAVVFWKILPGTDKVTGEDVTIPMLRSYTVFHQSQCDGLPAEPEAPARPVVVEAAVAHPAADALIERYTDRPTIHVGGDHAHYRPSIDVVTMPARDRFTSVSGYYATLFHELAHSTGHASRLNRKELADMATFGDTAYSTEELTAELTAAFCCAAVGLDQSHLPQSAAYLKSWLKAFQNDPRMLITASARAQKAFDYIAKPAAEEIDVPDQDAVAA